MISTYTRFPQFEIEVRRPDYTVLNYEDELIATFGVIQSKEVSTACISYEFSESLSSPSSSFSFNLTLERDSSGKTWMDKIQIRDLVFFKEHGKTKFVGYVTNRRYAARMGEKAPQRMITISGMNIGNLLVSFSIVMDQHILAANKTAQSASQQFMSSIASKIEVNQSLAGLLKAIIKSYLDMQDAIGESGASGIRQIIDTFFDLSSKFSTQIVAKYPMALSLFQMGENNLFNILQSIITPPFHEMYSKWNPSTNKFELIVRPTPFDPEDWSKLPLHVVPDNIPPLFLQSYDIGNSDSEVYTVFGVFLPGSGFSREKVLTLENFSLNLKKDTTKWPYYGYKPLFVELKFFNRSNESTFQAGELMRLYSQKLYDWFNNNPNYYSGTVTLMNVQNQQYPSSPTIGERLGLLGGEFYIEDVHHSWEYEGPMTLSLSVSRGFTYSQAGIPQYPIAQIGQKIGILETLKTEE